MRKFIYVGGVLAILALFSTFRGCLPTGSKGPQWEMQRANLVELLSQEGIHDDKVLSVIGEIPRHKFIPRDWRYASYVNRTFQLADGRQSVLPLSLAYIIQEIGINENDIVLEIGTGTGYNSAVLSRLAKFVHTIEPLPTLASSAEFVLVELEYNNIKVHNINGKNGLVAEAPFDKIIVNMPIDEISPILLSQLKVGGLLIAQLGRNPFVFEIINRVASGYESRSVRL